MIIFRCRSYIPLILLAGTSGCDISENVDEESIISEDSESIYEVSLKRDDKSIIPEKLLKDYQDNPNRFGLTNEGKSFTVSGKIERVPEFEKLISSTSGYYLPIKIHDDMLDKQYDRVINSNAGLPNLRSISLFIENFSQQKAAELNRDQEIEANCSKIRIVQNGLVFDDCNLVSNL